MARISLFYAVKVLRRYKSIDKIKFFCYNSINNQTFAFADVDGRLELKTDATLRGGRKERANERAREEA